MEREVGGAVGDGLGGGVRLEVEATYDDVWEQEERAREDERGGKKKHFSGKEQRRLFLTAVVK